MADHHAQITLSSTTVERCLSCGQTKADLVLSVSDSLTQDLYGDRLSGNVRNTLVKCSNCGLVRLSSRLTDEALKRVYADWYSRGYSGTQAAKDGDKSRFKEFEKGHLARISKVVSPPGSLLDVGTGSGLFLQVASRHGWRAIGLDFSSQAAELARNHHDVEVRVGGLSDLPANESYDVITMFDYLEHTTRPAEDIEEAVRRLKPGGHLVVRVPNLGGWQARLMGPNWVGIISLHLSYFEPNTLTDLLSDRNLVVVYSDVGNYQSLSELLGNKLAWVLSRAASGRPEQGGARDKAESQKSSKVRRALRFALASIYELVDHVGGWFGQSNYIFVVARKPR